MAGLTTFGAMAAMLPCAASGSRWIAGVIEYAVHQRPRPGARLIPERSLTTPIHGGRNRRRAIEASTGIGRRDLEGLVSRGERERSAGIVREVGVETGTGIGRGETAEIKPGDVDPLIDAPLVGRGVEP